MSLLTIIKAPPNQRRIVNLNRNRQILTRLQERNIRQTFPFLQLPAELRNIIYDLCINFNGIEKFFNRYYTRVSHSIIPSNATAPYHKPKTPTIFLANRQTFAEAVSLLSTKSVVFDHGLLDLNSVHDVISENVLQKLSSITITVKGHPILQSKILPMSWRGYMNLITDLSIILRQGHKLKNLTIDFEDKALKRHMTQCFGDQSYDCEFREQMQQACNDLRLIRGIGCVTITGIPSQLALELKARMESKPMSFLDLPSEIRNQIYEYCADWSDISTQLARMMKSWNHHAHPPQFPSRSTPTILLLNKKVSHEALSVLRSKPLTITFPEDHYIQKQDQVPNILKFITSNTLQTVKHLNIKIETWEWIYTLDNLLPTIAEKHNLETIKIYLKDHLKDKFLKVPGKKYPDGSLHMSLGGLASIRGVGRVTFEGDLPDVYTAPLIQSMESAFGTADVLPLKAICADGTVVDADAEES